MCETCKIYHDQLAARDRQIAQLDADRVRLLEEKWEAERRADMVPGLEKTAADHKALTKKMAVAEIEVAGADLRAYHEIPVAGFALMVNDDGEVMTAMREGFELPLTNGECEELRQIYAQRIDSAMRHYHRK